MPSLAFFFSHLHLSWCEIILSVIGSPLSVVLGQSGKSSGCSFLRAVPSTSAAPVGSIMINSHLAHPASSSEISPNSQAPTTYSLPVELEAVPHQILWQYCSLPQSTTSFYSDLLSLLETAALPELLQRALSVEQVRVLGCEVGDDTCSSAELVCSAPNCGLLPPS